MIFSRHQLSYNILIISDVKVLNSIQVYTIFHISKLTYTSFLFIIDHKLKRIYACCFISFVNYRSLFARLSFSRPPHYIRPPRSLVPRSLFPNTLHAQNSKHI